LEARQKKGGATKPDPCRGIGGLGEREPHKQKKKKGGRSPELENFLLSGS